VLVVVSVHNQRTLSENEAGVPHLALSSASALLVTCAVEVSTGASGVKGAKKTLGGLNVEAVDDHWEFWDIIDSVATSLDEGCTSRSSESFGKL